MSRGTLRKVGGSVMLSIPPVILNKMGLEAGMTVEISLTEDRCLTIRPSLPSYTMSQLLDECDDSSKQTEEKHDLLDSSPAGQESI